jgi:hypothetical protein
MYCVFSLIYASWTNIWSRRYIKDLIYILYKYLSFLYCEVVHENKILKIFCERIKRYDRDVLQKCRRNERQIRPGYGLECWNWHKDKKKMQKRSCSNPFYASDWMPYTVNKRRKGKPCTDEYTLFCINATPLLAFNNCNFVRCHS